MVRGPGERSELEELLDAVLDALGVRDVPDEESVLLCSGNVVGVGDASRGRIQPNAMTSVQGSGYSPRRQHKPIISNVKLFGVSIVDLTGTAAFADL